MLMKTYTLTKVTILFCAPSANEAVDPNGQGSNDLQLLMKNRHEKLSNSQDIVDSCRFSK